MTLDQTQTAMVAELAAVPDLGSLSDLRSADALETAVGPWGVAMLAALQGRASRVEGLCILLPDADSGRLRPVAFAPPSRRPSDALVAVAATSAAGGQPALRPASAGVPLAIATLPLMIDGQARGVVGIEARGSSRGELQADLQAVQWGAAWLRELIRAGDARDRQEQYDRAVSALNAVVAVAGRDDFIAAATAAVTDLAARFECDRVSLGLRRFGRSRISAVSHSAQFSRRMKVLRDLEQAQEEAIDQKSTVLWPEPGGDAAIVARAHATFGQGHGVGQVYTVPLWSKDRFIGAVTFERPAARPFRQDDLDMLEAVTTVLAPIIEDKKLNDRWLITKAGDVIWAQLGRLFGPNYLARKLVVLGLLAVGAGVTLTPVTDRVAADAIIKGAVEHSVVAPFEGFVAEANVRAGSMVAAGAVMARLDDRDLVLELLRLDTVARRAQIEYDRAIAARDRTEAQVLQTQIAQTAAQRQLVEQQRARTVLMAPFDGLVIAGDLSQSIGSAVTRGQVLFVVAPDRSYRIDIAVPESRIAEVVPGQTGTLRVTALPDRTFPMSVVQITPVATYGGGKTTFKVEAQLSGRIDGLQPGMEGAVRIDIAEARLIDVWSRPMVKWARLTLWRLWPV